jgi:hypothetical protein
MLGDCCAECRPALGADAPWSNRDGALKYLATASGDELAVLSRTAALMLEGGDWWGIHSKNGWVSRLSDVSDVLWHRAATDFIAAYRPDQPGMNEGFVCSPPMISRRSCSTTVDGVPTNLGTSTAQMSRITLSP